MNRISVLALGALAALGAAHASTITVGPVGPFTIGGTSDTLALSGGSVSFTPPATLSQGQTFSVGAGGPVANYSFSFNDTVTIDGITKVLTVNGIDKVGATGDQLVIPSIGSVNFGALTLSDTSFTSAVVPFGTSQSIALTALITATPEPSTFIYLGTGLIAIAGAARRRFSA